MNGGPAMRGPGAGTVLLGRYELTDLLARGGMSEVFEAEDRRLGRHVAVKLFRAAPEDRQRFDAEALMLAGLNHPGLVRVYDAGEEHGEAFVVLELIRGPSLREVLARRGALPAREVATLGLEIADALAYVHDRGVAHRDVTPANVLLGADGHPRVTDFGIATLVDRARITSASTALGTAAYMSPEQVQGQDVTPATDVYALGLVLLELLTGRVAFDGPAPEAALARLTRSPDTTTDVPAAWQPLLAVMTHQAADERPSATEVSDRLRRLAAADSGRAVVAAPVGGAGAHDSGPFDPTQAVDTATASLPVAGGTAVMPAAMRPVPESPPSPVTTWWRNRRIVAAILVALLAAALVSAANPGDGITVPPSTTAVTTTVAPATTVTPEEKDDGKEDDDEEEDKDDDEGGGGGNKGKGRGGEDD